MSTVCQRWQQIYATPNGHFDDRPFVCLIFEYFIPTDDTYGVTGRGPDGPCDQISAGYQVSVYLLPWGAHSLFVLFE